jgi:fumarate reductase flavoprotein subunit
MKAESPDKLLSIEAKKVILATGGFAKNDEMLEKYIPEFAGSSELSAATVGATGDGINLALGQGAEMYEEPWIIGLGIVDKIAPSAIGNLAFNFSNVYVNEKGERFFNEADHYAIVTNHVATQERPYLILDSNEMNADYIEQLEEKSGSGEVFKADTLADLAKEINVPAENLEQTIENYNAGDSDFEKDSEYLVPLNESPFYAVKIYPMTMGTFSGVKTNEHFNVLDENGEVIPNLYAVGETANKLIYNQVYMSGSAVQFALTSGRLSGKHAAQNLSVVK